MHCFRHGRFMVAAIILLTGLVRGVRVNVRGDNVNDDFQHAGSGNALQAVGVEEVPGAESRATTVRETTVHRDDDGNTPLHRAARDGDIEELRSLLDAGGMSGMLYTNWK